MMGSPAQPGVAGTAARLPAERWGWQLRRSAAAAPLPFTTEPPGLPAIEVGWLTRLAQRHARATRNWRRHALRAAVLVAMAALTWLLSAGLGGPVSGLAAAVTAAAAGFAGLAARPVLLGWRADARYRQWQRGVSAQLSQVAGSCRDWVQQRAAHERRHQPAAPRWEAVRPTATQRIDVYGGDTAGWTSLLSAAATSMISAGSELTVVDLSQDGVGQRLNAGTPGTRVRLPDQLAGMRLLKGLPAADIAAVISEVVAAVDRDDASRTVDTAILEQVIGCLAVGAADPAGGGGDGCEQVTFARLHAALRVVARMERQPAELAAGEYRALVDLLGEAGRRTAEPRLFRIAAALRQLAAMEAGSDGAPVDTDGRLLVWEVSDQLSDLGADLLAQVTVQVLLHRLRRSSPPATGRRCLAVVGADRLRRAAVERLDQLARRRGIRLVLCSRHLREDAAEVLGGGDAVVFMRLGNAREAEQAAAFIGREHQLVASQFTVSRSASGSLTAGGSTSHATSEQESTTDGRQWSRSLDYHGILGTLFGLPHEAASGTRGEQRSTTTGTSTSLTESTSWSAQAGHTVSGSVSYQRTYEYTVTPKLLQELSPTAFILVDPQDPESPRLGDCGIDPVTDRGSDPPNQQPVPPAWVE